VDRGRGCARVATSPEVLPRQYAEQADEDQRKALGRPRRSLLPLGGIAPRSRRRHGRPGLHRDFTTDIVGHQAKPPGSVQSRAALWHAATSYDNNTLADEHVKIT
jgi:hypothetical protein